MHRILRVARTIADLAGSEHIGTAHLTEALGYRGMDRTPQGQAAGRARLDTQGGWSRRRYPSSAQATRRSRMKDASDRCAESPGQPSHNAPPRLTQTYPFAAPHATPMRQPH